MTTESSVGPSVGARLRLGAAAIVLAWLLSIGAHLVGVDWVLPPLLLAGLVSVQRAGGTLLDRLLPAVAQLFGALCVAGLVISVWPWHLHPVPIAGCAFTALVVLALVTGRRPRLTLRTPHTDVLIWLAVLVVGVLAFVPFAVRDLGGRIGIVAVGEDFSRHFLLYDMIGKVGGYAFMHLPDAARFAPDDYGFGYPQGTHLMYAVLDRFVRSSSVNADAVTAMDVLLWCHLGTYLFLALALLWAARRAAGPGVGPAALLLVLGAVAAVLYVGDLFTAFVRGYPNEALGLALVAMLTAILARPLAHLREQVITVAALIVGISFTYHLYLPYALLVTLAWAWRHRHELPRRFTVIVALPVLPLMLITPLAIRPSGTGTLLLAPGTAYPVDRVILGLAVLTAVAGLFVRGGWRCPAHRLLAFALAVAGVLVATLFAYQYAMVGHSVYYFEKLLHMFLVVALVGLGSATRLVPRLGAPGTTTVDGRVRYGIALVGALVIAGGLAASGGPWHAKPLASAGLRYGLGLDRGSPAAGRQAVDLVRRYPDANGKVDVVLTQTPYANFFGTLFTAVMQRNYRHGESWYGFLTPTSHRTLADLETYVRLSPVPVRFIVRNQSTTFLVADSPTPAPTNAEAAQYLARRYPDKVEVVIVP